MPLQTMPLQTPEYVSDAWKESLFTEKVVFCTGGGGTICSAQVRALVYLGANACIVGRNVEKTERVARDIATVRRGALVLGIGGVDVRDSEGLKAAADRCVNKLGSIDYAIAGAAGNFLASINHISPNAFKAVMDIDVLGSYNTVKATMPHLVKSAQKHQNSPAQPLRQGTGGRIIFLSSTTHYIGSPFQTHVAAAKAGVDALSNNVALEFGPHGVTSNVISPGPIEGTEGVARLVPKGSEAAVRKRQPLGRYGLTKDVADATVYLFSETGSYVSGHTLVVDGASWRAPGGSLGIGNTLPYPDFLLAGKPVSDVKGQKEHKL